MPYPHNVNLALSTILASIGITPSEGGWDGPLNDQLDEARVDLRVGLLGRQINLAPASSSAGSILITAPAGHSALVTEVHVHRRGSTPSALNSYDFGSQGINPNNWATGVSGFDNLSDDHRVKIITPNNAAPWIVNGDDLNNDFRVIRTAGTTIALDWHVFGRVWRNP